MKPLWRAAWGVTLIVLATGRVAAADDPAPTAAALERARAFMKGLFDPEFDLLPEFSGSKTYWLYHDNYLAAKILDPTEPEMARRIRAAITKHGASESGKIEILFNEAKRPLPFRHFQLTTVAEISGRLIRTERVTERALEGWEAYADLLFFAAMAEHAQNPKVAEQWLEKGLAMWDGKGFRDVVVEKHRLYATYKLALGLLAAQRCRRTLPMKDAILSRLASLQNKAGGWITDYDLEGKPRGLANVETTCMVILATQAAGQGGKAN